MQRGAGPRLVLAVDYGTTSTGVAYALADGLKERPILTLSGWPGSEKSKGRRLKVPSRISYRQSRELPCDWGFRCQPASETYAWTKLLLGVQYSSEQRSDTNPLNDPILERVMGMGILELPDEKSAVEVIADFLRHVIEYVLTQLPESIAKDCQVIEGIDFWITVPATWSAEQRSLMRHATQRAGFRTRAEDRVFFLSEPEAAMHAVAYLNGVELQPGDGVLVCDCGGGTVDAASFLVTESESRPYFKRLSEDIGVRCGGTDIEGSFYRYLEGNQARSFQRLPMSNICACDNPFTESMERLLAQYDGRTGGGHSLQLTLRTQRECTIRYNLTSRQFFLDENEIGDLFARTLEKIHRLVISQIAEVNERFRRSAINKVVMVGGLSASPYLQMKLNQILDETPGNITMIVPPEPEMAVARGAAACGLRGHVAPESTCQRHIGLERPHPARARLGSMGPLDPEVCWMIRKGERFSTDVYVTSIIQLPYQPTWPPTTTLRIYDCDLDAAPDQASCPGVRCVGQLVCNFGDVDLSKLVFEAVGGQGLYHLQIRVHAALTMTDGAVEFTAYALGQQIGQTTVE